MKVSDEINNPINPIKIPTIDEALELLGQVRDKQNRMAFETVLRIYGYAPKAESEEQLLAMNIISNAYWVGCILFK
ncbi:MAG TPA: hypothetical protein VIH57_14600 [Bacteroidales bacterium]